MLKRMPCIYVDWSGSSALRESEESAANVFCSESKATATKRPGGTEINHTLW
ncbi:hypothetical protein ACQKNB_24580 [Lysinibacillus xylanilyticus]|uniref:hypothetical protein n=1 Tax=Lysinibacillus xylanilyticus TaxID=582475 RepID=UPI003D08591C